MVAFITYSSQLLLRTLRLSSSNCSIVGCSLSPSLTPAINLLQYRSVFSGQKIPPQMPGDRACDIDGTHNKTSPMRHCLCLPLAFLARILRLRFLWSDEAVISDVVSCASVGALTIPACVHMLYLYKNIFIVPVKLYFGSWRNCIGPWFSRTNSGSKQPSASVSFTADTSSRNHCGTAHPVPSRSYRSAGTL